MGGRGVGALCLCISMCVHPVPGQCTTDEQDSLCVRSLPGFNPHWGAPGVKIAWCRLVYALAEGCSHHGLRGLKPRWSTPSASESGELTGALLHTFFQGSPAITPAACAMHSESWCLCSLCDAVDCRPTHAEVKTAPRGARTVCLPLVFTAIVGSISCGKLENFQSIKVDENHSSTTLGLCSSGCFSAGQTYFWCWEWGCISHTVSHRRASLFDGLRTRLKDLFQNRFKSLST